MKKLPFQQQGQLPITLNVRILKLWNPTVCSAPSAIRSITTQSQGGGRYISSSNEPSMNNPLNLTPLIITFPLKN